MAKLNKADAVDYYHDFMGGFRDILLFYGGGEKELINSERF